MVRWDISNDCFNSTLRIGVPMKTQYDLLEHYRSVIVPMAREHGINPWECVRLGNALTDHPGFCGPVEDYEFAIAILEGKPVFVGDKLYSKITGEEFTVKPCGFDWALFNWTPPAKQRTFVLDGVELVCPIDDMNGCVMEILGIDFYFDSMENRNRVANAISNILFQARDKE